MSSEISGSAPRNPILKLKSASRVSQPKALETNTQVTKQKAPSPETTAKSLAEHAGSLNILLDNIHSSTNTLEDTKSRLEEIGAELELALKAIENGETNSNTSFKEILEKIDAVATTQGNGEKNLLQGESIKTSLDASGNNVVSSNGADFSAQGLGLANIEFNNAQQAAQAIPEIKAAQQLLYTYKTKIGNDITTIKDQAYFTQGALFTATNGSTISDQPSKSDEAANLLALQTRQILRNTAHVPLASQSQQNLLRLF